MRYIQCKWLRIFENKIKFRSIFSSTLILIDILKFMMYDAAMQVILNFWKKKRKKKKEEEVSFVKVNYFGNYKNSNFILPNPKPTTTKYQSVQIVHLH